VCVCVRYDISDEWKGGFKQVAIKTLFIRSLVSNMCVLCWGKGWQYSQHHKTCAVRLRWSLDHPSPY